MSKPLWECNPLDPQILPLGTTLDPQGRMASVHDFYRKYRVRENGDRLAAPNSTLSYRSSSPATLLCFSVLCKEKISEKMSSNFFSKYKFMKGYTLETENLQPVSQLKFWLLSRSQSSLWFHEVPMSTSAFTLFSELGSPLNSRQFS